MKAGQSRQARRLLAFARAVTVGSKFVPICGCRGCLIGGSSSLSEIAGVGVMLGEQIQQGLDGDGALAGMAQVLSRDDDVAVASAFAQHLDVAGLAQIADDASGGRAR
ncbi:hypothetical protein [Nonomuraea jabiensis]|uniref:Uncharacterized protein n=1 Tax=Nonomuraea jabiensis TaxID=882448 RepID=A0A7W9GDC0_9ACTN|nr:hypothetical protein [Nonomuraea jabiensis]MBB5781728.1 hypothetical protein [Nonomuraea jabiensis]